MKKSISLLLVGILIMYFSNVYAGIFGESRPEVLEDMIMYVSEQKILVFHIILIKPL